MTTKSRLELTVGIFIVIGLIVLVFFVFFIRDFQLVKPGYRFDIVFGFANGLKVGAPARLAGVDVGEVKSIDIFYEPDSSKTSPSTTLRTGTERSRSTRVKVRVWVKKEAQVPMDSEVLINTLGLLGEKYIEIIPGKNYSLLAGEGSLVSGRDPVAVEEVTEETKKMVLKIEQAVGGINEVLSQIKTGQGTLGKLVYEDTIYQNIEGSTKDLKELTEDLKRHPWKLFWKPKEKPGKK